MLSYLENPSLKRFFSRRNIQNADVEEAGDKLKLTLL